MSRLKSSGWKYNEEIQWYVFLFPRWIRTWRLRNISQWRLIGFLMINSADRQIMRDFILSWGVHGDRRFGRISRKSAGPTVLEIEGVALRQKSRNFILLFLCMSISFAYSLELARKTFSFGFSSLRNPLAQSTASSWSCLTRTSSSLGELVRRGRRRRKKRTKSLWNVFDVCERTLAHVRDESVVYWRIEFEYLREENSELLTVSLRSECLSRVKEQKPTNLTKKKTNNQTKASLFFAKFRSFSFVSIIK